MRTAPFASRRPVAAAILVAATLGTAACGTGASGITPGSAYSMTPAAPAHSATATAQAGPLAGLTADQIAARATADLKTVSSVHITGSGTDSGQTVGMNLTLGTRGCKGRLSIKGEGSFALLKIGTRVWIKPDNRFWKYAAGSSLSAAVMRLLSGKYIEPSAKGSSLGSLAGICNRSQFASAFGTKLTGLVKGATTTIAGQPALQIKDAGDPDSAYVTISARPEFLRLDAGRSGQFDFSGYDAPLTLTPPPASQTLNGAKYGF